MTNPTNQQRQVRPRTGLITLIIHHSITVLILILFIGLATWGYLTFGKTDFFATVDHAAIQDGLRPTLEAAQRERLQVALAVYHHLESRYPGRLTELVEAGLLLESDLYYPQGAALWSYERSGDNFILERQSADQTDPD